MNDIMGTKDIAFPNLGIYLEHVPKSFTVFGFTIALYGVIIGIGVMAGFAMWLKQAKLDGQDPEIYWDFAIYAIIFSILGARIYYVIFSWDYYKDNFKEKRRQTENRHAGRTACKRGRFHDGRQRGKGHRHTLQSK